MRQSFDVLVAGAGPAGSVAALELCRRGLSVALVEQDVGDTPRIGETLAPIIRQQLAALGLTDRFLGCEPLESYGIQSAWESAEPRYQEFLLSPYGCGWHVDRAKFDAMLIAAAADAGVVLRRPARVETCRANADGWHIVVREQATVDVVHARMLIDATGRTAALARQFRSQAQMTDRLVGVVTFVGRKDPSQWTLIEAIEEGWWYSAPLPGERMAITYLTDADLWRPSRWPELLRHAPLTAQRAGNPLPLPMRIVSAASIVRSPVTGPTWIAVGDSAIAFDPLSGQGISKAIDSGTRAAVAIARFLDGDQGGFADYANWVHESYEAYLVTRNQFYGAVKRWPDAPFWQRRAEPTPSAVPYAHAQVLDGDTAGALRSSS